MLATLADPYTIFVPESRDDQPHRVLRVETGREFEAKRNLEYRGVDVYLPTYQYYRRQDRHYLALPLFPGYLFSPLADTQRRRAIDTFRVIDILRVDREHDALVEPAEIARLRAIEGMRQAEPWERIPVGAAIRIVEGPLTGTHGKLAGRTSAEQIVISFSMLGRMVSLKVPGWWIEVL